MKSNILALLGGVVGGVLGFFGCWWIVQQGFYALVLPGALVGIGASLFKSRSIAVCVGCGVLALGFGLFTEWHLFPYVKDDGLGYFVTHVHQLKPLTLIMIAVGAAIGFWSPFRSRPGAA